MMVRRRPLTASTSIISDGTDTIAAQSFGITVNPVNDAPVLATNAGVTVDEGSTGSVIGAAVLATD